MNTAVLNARTRMTQNSVIVQDDINFKGRAGKPYPGTFTRSSKAWLGGVEYAVNAPRTVDYAGGKLVLLEGVRTNLTGNHSMQGGTVGDSKTDSATVSVPSLWGFGNWANIGGITRTFVGKTTLPDGTVAIDLRIQGTSDKSATIPITFAPLSPVTIATSDFMTGSVDIGLAAGTLAGVTTINMLNFEGTSAGAYNGETPGALAAKVQASLTSELKTYSVSNQTVKQDGTSARWTSVYLYVGVAAGTPVDFTLRFARPQMEKAPFRSSFIRNDLASGAAVTRQVDLWHTNPLASLVAPGKPFTLALAAYINGVNAAEYPSLFSASTSGANEIWLRQYSLAFHNGAQPPINFAQTVGAWQRFYVVYDGKTWQVYQNGTLKGSNQNTLSAPMTYAAIGTLSRGANGVNSNNSANSYIAPGAPALAIPFIRPWALSASEIATEDARWQAALDAVTLPPL